ARQGYTEPEAAGADARGSLLRRGRGPGRPDRLRLGAGLDGRRGQRRRGGRRAGPDGEGAGERRDGPGGGRREPERRGEGYGVYHGHGPLRRDPRGQAAALRGAVSCVLDGRGLGPHRPAAPRRGRGRRGDPV
ncbi:MAG: RidA/YER057c/UK114 superfamily protein, partial [uncultured Rubrobacteraceae bacterium]